jgi:hypothetical protein
MKCYIAIYSIKFSSFDLTFGYEVILGGPDEGGGGAHGCYANQLRSARR